VSREGGKGGVPITHHGEFFSPIPRHVKRSKYIGNFTFWTLKALLKEELCRFNHKDALANM